MTYVPRAIVEAELVLQQMLRDKTGPSAAPRLTNVELAAMMRQYHADPHVLSDMDQQRCAGIVYLTDPASVGYRPAFRAAFGLEGGSAG